MIECGRRESEIIATKQKRNKRSEPNDSHTCSTVFNVGIPVNLLRAYLFCGALCVSAHSLLVERNNFLKKSQFVHWRNAMSRNLKNHVNENVATQTSSSQLSAEFVSSVAHADSDNRPQRHSHSDESHRQRKTKKVESKRQQQSFAWAPQMAIDNVDTNDNDSSSSIYCDRYINVSAFESIDSLHCDQCAFVHQTNSTRSNCVYHLCRCHFDNCIDYNRFNYQQSARCDTKFGAISVRTVHPNRNEVNLVNSSSQQCHRIIYENLCQFCGSAIGSAASHLNCNRKWPSEQLKNWRDNNFNAIKSNNVDANDGDCNDNDDNIYENICARCHSICSSETCSKCLREGNKVNEQKQQHKVNVENVGATTKVSHANGKTFGKQFSNLFDSLKRKLKDRTQLSSSTFATEPKEPTKSKIEIIHNFDKVFKTNQTFDLDEIVQLKLQNTSAHDIYGKLDESVCSLVTNRAEEFLSSRQHFLSTSESNFFADRQQLQLQQHQNQQQQRQQQLPRQFNSGVAFDLPFDLETFASDSALYLVPPSYEDAIQNSLYKSVSSVTQSTPASSFYSHVSSSSSLSSSTTFAASVWSLSFDNFLNNNESLHQWMTSLRTQTEDYFDTDFPLFECSIIKCIPAKTIFTEKSQESKSKTKTKSTLSLDSLELHDRVAKFKENFNAQMLSKLNAFDANNLMVTSATATSSICFIESDSLQPVVIRSTNEIDSIRKYFENVKNFYVVQIALATGLNRTILICGDTRLHFLCKFLSSDRHTFDKRQINWIFSTDRVQQFFEKMSIEKTFGDTKKLPAIGNADKTMAKEFQAFSNVKHDHSNSMQSNESTNENTDCSSNSELMRDDSSQNALNNEEWTTADESADHERSIYQTIWTFETLGAASTNDSDEMCESELSEAIVDDCSEWEEVTNAEFVFSSSRFSSHANTPITHRRRDEMVNTQPQMNCKISNVSFTAYDDDNDERNCKSSSSPLPIYRRVCILYNGENTKFNKIIHDHNRNVDNELNPFGNEYANIVQNVMRPTETATNTEKTETKNSGSSSRTSDSNNRKFGRNSVSEESENANKTDVNDRATNVQSLVSIDSVIAWQNMLRSVNYIEDEEDLVSVKVTWILQWRNAKTNRREKIISHIIFD